MIDLDKPEWRQHRFRETEARMIGNGIKPRDSDFGVFGLRIGMHVLGIIASRGQGWDHVSVSIINGTRCPYWEEMDAVKRLFFKPDEVVMQLHPAEKDHVSIHPYVLHLWRPHGIKLPLPPKGMI